MTLSPGARQLHVDVWPVVHEVNGVASRRFAFLTCDLGPIDSRVKASYTGYI